LNLILVEPSELDADGCVTLRDARGAHALGVLKVTLDQPIRVGIVDGALGTGLVTALLADGVRLRCAFDTVPPRPPVDLLLALPRPKVLRRLWAQLAALGVGRVILTNAERVERNYFDTHLLDPTGYRPLLLEGLQQARDSRLPDVSVHRQFRVLVEDDLDGLTGTATRLVADPAATLPIRHAIHSRPSGVNRALLAVGPEGGWNAFELDLLRSHGFSGVGMGARILRSDTACIALLALVHEALR